MRDKARERQREKERESERQRERKRAVEPISVNGKCHERGKEK